MPTANTHVNGTVQHWVTVRAEPEGQFTAQAVGIPEVIATAETRKKAIDLVHEKLNGLLSSGELVAIQVPQPNPLLQWFGHADPNDPDEQAYLEELARARKEDLEQTLRELDKECSNTSSIPTT